MMTFLKRLLIWILGFILLGIIIFLALLYWDYLGFKATPQNNHFQNISKTNCANVPASDVHIAYITDTNYIYPTQVSVYSAIKNKCPQSNYYFHIITDNVDSQKATNAFRPFASDTVHFNIVPQKRAIDTEFSNYLEHISPTAMMKFIIPEALTQIDRVIYMDSDTLVTKDLQGLFNTDLESNIAGAVSDLGIVAQAPYLATLGYKEKIYYNSGVLLLDLKKMREHQISQQLNEYAKKSSQLVFIDQDAYNIILKKHIKTLPYIYNCMAMLYLYKNLEISFWAYLKHRATNSYTHFTSLYADDIPFFYRHIFKETVILHYFGFSKPWKANADTNEIQLFFDLWHQYASDLEKDYRIKKATISPTAIKQENIQADNP